MSLCLRDQTTLWLQISVEGGRITFEFSEFFIGETRVASGSLIYKSKWARNLKFDVRDFSRFETCFWLTSWPASEFCSSSALAINSISRKLHPQSRTRRRNTCSTPTGLPKSGLPQSFEWITLAGHIFINFANSCSCYKCRRSNVCFSFNQIVSIYFLRHFLHSIHRYSHMLLHSYRELNWCCLGDCRLWRNIFPRALSKLDRPNWEKEEDQLGKDFDFSGHLRDAFSHISDTNFWTKKRGFQNFILIWEKWKCLCQNGSGSSRFTWHANDVILEDVGCSRRQKHVSL